MDLGLRGRDRIDNLTWFDAPARRHTTGQPPTSTGTVTNIVQP
ncbi:hypothetical protein [Nodosilinea sp. E11]|nr:hypothetical protein [Nodosilinea sp. E11]WOD41970.1 hypothetical protein RRF56_14335 [Nodosilinea sp. E11]